MGNKININILFPIVVFGVVAISLGHDIFESLNRPETPDLYKDFLQYSVEQVESFEFYEATGFDSKKQLPLKEKQLRKLFHDLQTGLETYTKSRYLSTDHYILTITFIDKRSFKIDFLLQNYDDISVDFKNRSYDSAMILDWFKNNKSFFDANR